MKRTPFVIAFFLISWIFSAQNIRTVYHNVNNGIPSSSVNSPGTILYPTGYTTYNVKTPVVFVHGFTGKLTGAYEAHIDIVRQYGLNAAFVQLKPMGTTEENGMLLKKMIDRITAHFNTATVSIVAHSKGGMDTERALYGHNPYDYSIPSFGYEKVDGVYTFGSPLRGSRLADVGSSLSWTGIAWIAMWYTNGFSMTSANVQAFRNWAKSWRINSNGTFRNYYNPNGASYSRINLSEDNTTRWWAHQSDDPCYADRWYFCYGGNVFHHTVGAYLDAYWEWDWFNSGWRNWHPENDGFIAVYRAKRSQITNNSPALTPGAGDSNYMTMNDADHISLWDPGEGHFRDEVAPYLHRGLYYYGRQLSRPANENNKQNPVKDEHEAVINPIYVSNGVIYIAKDGSSSIIIENDEATYRWLVFSENPVNEVILKGYDDAVKLQAEETHFDEFTHAYVSIFQHKTSRKGFYEMHFPGKTNVVVFSENLNPVSGFGVKWNINENKGYEGHPVEVKITGFAPEEIQNAMVIAELIRISDNGNPVTSRQKKKISVNARPVNATEGLFEIRLPRLQKGEQYALTVKAFALSGDKFLHRNAVTTFYVYEELPVKDITVQRPKEIPNRTGQLNLYPNPAENFATLTLPFEGHKQISVTDISGKTIWTKVTDKSSYRLPVAKWKKGTYLVRVETNGMILSGKLIVR